MSSHLDMSEREPQLLRWVEAQCPDVQRLVRSYFDLEDLVPLFEDQPYVTLFDVVPSMLLPTDYQKMYAFQALAVCPVDTKEDLEDPRHGSPFCRTMR